MGKNGVRRCKKNGHDSIQNTARVHDDIIVIAAEEEEHVTSCSTRGESRIFRVYCKIIAHLVTL